MGFRPSREIPFFFMSSHAFHQVPWTQTGYSAAILSETSTPAGLLVARARIFHSLLKPVKWNNGHAELPVVNELEHFYALLVLQLANSKKKD